MRYPWISHLRIKGPHALGFQQILGIHGYIPTTAVKETWHSFTYFLTTTVPHFPHPPLEEGETGDKRGNWGKVTAEGCAGHQKQEILIKVGCRLRLIETYYLNGKFQKECPLLSRI
jgi:hypothetical protein